MTTPNNRDEQLQKLRDMVKGIDIAMMTTVDEDGSLRSRPMSCNSEIEANGDVWFFTYASSHKVTEVEQQQHVNLSFADPHKQRYVSMSGAAQLVRDRQKLAELWQPQLKAWFPKELDEPDIALLKVTVEKAEYWDAPSSWLAHTISFLKAVTTGKTADTSENVKLSLK
ncbi:pyridoxamine 5'-phosphate oxidase family protein [Oscillatoria sp. FACHB-1407]|uniref:pyridoxamine 5'-phosphate oxidase family protein n=1 Tax=Oscillatoria sp. FACHB-1407 TaxID=2692847 RepID=UPI001689917D|nr:pyridoxamine 5'-phosphate oxidase family protein [Oscillatoria sp. FACHB-1407]MBD2460257.1 pyridoxamine 5'-phosphate oxidase family protein [Oscillatoria sp. FACHB-1407]